MEDFQQSASTMQNTVSKVLARVEDQLHEVQASKQDVSAAVTQDMVTRQVTQVRLEYWSL
jgi:hypothetical protein